MNEQDYNQLLEVAWRRKLSPSEEVDLQNYLAANPASREDWREEAALTDLLEHFCTAPPVASNFTASVVQAAGLKLGAPKRRPGPWASGSGLWSWLPKAAFAGLFIGMLFIAYHEEQVRARVALARNVLEVTTVVSASDPSLMRDFEPIRRLSEPQSKVDDELLALLK